MPIHDLSDARVHERLVPTSMETSDEQVSMRAYVEWMDAIPLYANHQAASEKHNIHPTFHQLLSQKFPRLGLNPVGGPGGGVEEKSLTSWGIPDSAISGSSRPDSVCVSRDIVFAVGEFKQSIASTLDAVSQAFGYMCAGVIALELSGVPWEQAVFGGFICNGLQIQFMGAYLVDTGYPSVTVTSHIIDLTSKMGVALANLYFRKLEGLAEYVDSFHAKPLKFPLRHKPRGEWTTYKSLRVYVRVGGLRARHRADFDCALRYNLLVFKELRDLGCVVHPIGMASGMVASKGSGGTDEVHVLYRNVELDAYVRGIPPRSTAEAYICALEDAIAAIHAKGVVHGNLDPRRCFWKKDGDGVQVKIVDWDVSFFMECGVPAYFVEQKQDDYRMLDRYADTGDARDMDRSVVALLRKIVASSEGWWEKICVENDSESRCAMLLQRAWEELSASGPSAESLLDKLHISE